MTAFEVPLVNTPQQLTITLNGVEYQLTIVWNEQSQCWVMDIADDSSNPILQGIPLITGTDLLSPFGYLGFGGQLRVQTDSDPDAVPTFENLGVTGHLYFVTTP